MGETLEVSVQDPRGPVAGATVTAARESGASTATTDASGHATLAGVLAGDVVHVTADGHIPLTFSQIPARTDTTYFDGGALTVQLFLGAPTDTVTVRGAFSNGSGAGEWWIVAPEGGQGFAGATDYTLEVPTGVEVVATVLEFDLMPVALGLRAGRNATVTTARTLTIPASASDTSVDVDLAMEALPIRTASGTFPIPPAPHAFHDTGDGFFIVLDRAHPGWFLGESGIIQADAASTRFEYQANWIEPAGVTRPITTYSIANGRTAVRTTVDGYPSDGAQDVTFLDALEVVSPGLLVPWRVGEVATLEGLAPTLESVVNLSNEAETETLWIVIAPPGAPVRLPPPPPGGVGATTLTGRFVACEREGAFCRRAAVGPGRTVEL